MRTVMIVDDEPHVIKGLVEHIAWDELRFAVTGTAADGAQALERIREAPPDLLITDIYMPNIDGLELIRAVRSAFPSVQIVIHSGYDDFENARTAMRYGVQHFLLKPSTVTEITRVIREVTREIEAQEKRRNLEEQYRVRQAEYLHFLKDALIREMLVTRYQPAEVPREKLELLGIAADARVGVINFALVRPPYLTKSREREWQLMKFGAGNIIREIAAEGESGEGAAAEESAGAGQHPGADLHGGVDLHAGADFHRSVDLHAGADFHRSVDLHVVDLSDSNFLIAAFADRSRSAAELLEICRRLAERIVDNILSYLKISLSAGIGRVKEGIHTMIDAYLESEQALEAAEYQELNRVYVYEAFEDSRRSALETYPLDRLKEMYNAVFNKEYEQLPGMWRAFAQSLLERHTPLFVLQNLCVNMAGVLMMEASSHPDGAGHQRTMAEWIAQIYALPATKELCGWMSERIDEWAARTKEEISGRRSHKLVRDVMEYVKHHYDQDIALAEIAESLYVHRNYLSYLFKRVTGETFVAYLNRFRIEKAKELMREKHYLISEVSGMVGFQNPTYFSQVFKSITGKSPSEYYK